MASKLKRYEVKVQPGRNTVDTILKLTPEEAERLGATEYVKEGATPARTLSKSRAASTKPRAPRNKAAKPAADKTATPADPPKSGMEDATDPGASE